METTAPFFNTFRPSRIAGGLLVLSAVLAFVLEGAVFAVAAVLGLALCVVQDSSKLDVFRVFVFLWCAGSLVLSVPYALEGEWALFARSVLLVSSIGGLMLENLKEPTIAVLALVGFGAVLW